MYGRDTQFTTTVFKMATKVKRVNTKPSAYITKQQRSEIIDKYMEEGYEQWFENAPSEYDEPSIRRAELNAMNNSELIKFVLQDFGLDFFDEYHLVL